MIQFAINYYLLLLICNKPSRHFAKDLFYPAGIKVETDTVSKVIFQHVVATSEQTRAKIIMATHFNCERIREVWSVTDMHLLLIGSREKNVGKVDLAVGGVKLAGVLIV